MPLKFWQITMIYEHVIFKVSWSDQFWKQTVKLKWQMLYKILYKISTFKKIISFYKYQPPINSKPNTAIYDGQKLNLPFKKYYYYLPPLLACKPYKNLLYYEIPTSIFFGGKKCHFSGITIFFPIFSWLVKKASIFCFKFP